MPKKIFQAAMIGVMAIGLSSCSTDFHYASLSGSF
jgi:hypothetical protein